jgi:hypothetical protein
MLRCAASIPETPNGLLRAWIGCCRFAVKNFRRSSAAGSPGEPAFRILTDANLIETKSGRSLERTTLLRFSQGLAGLVTF